MTREIKKNIYEAPELEITAFETEDAVTTSALVDNDLRIDLWD